MRLLVTGGSGFLGCHVLSEAAGRGHDVIALARSASAARRVAQSGARPVAGDLDDPAGLPAAFRLASCEVLLNIASLGFGHASVIVAAAESAGISRAVFVSTTAVSTSLPAPSKRVRLDAEQTIKASGLDWTIARPTMIYGAAGDRNMSRLLTALTRVPLLPVPGAGRHLQQPVHVADAARALVTAAERPEVARMCYDLAGPEPLTFANMLRECASSVASRTRFVPVPLTPVIALTGCYERISRAPRIRAEQLWRLAEDKAFAIDQAIRDLDYAPRPFAEGIAAQARAMGLAR